MTNKRLVGVLLDGVIVFGSIMLGGKVQALVDEVKLLKMKEKLYIAAIEGQQKIIEKLQSEKEEES